MEFASAKQGRNGVGRRIRPVFEGLKLRFLAGGVQTLPVHLVGSEDQASW